MTIIVGINAYHGDSSACLIRDGQLLAAAEEERFRRVKHWAGLPSQSVAYCLKEARLSLADVNVIAVNTDPKAALGKKIEFALTRRLNPAVVIKRLRSARQRSNVAEALATELGQSFKGRLQQVEHHYCHLASAFLVSPFDEAVVVSVDGFGDFASAAWGLGRGNAITIDGRVHFPHSLGLFYTAITQLIGFPHYGDEYKIMGLAPYGEPQFLDQMRRIVGLKRDGSYELDLSYFCHHTGSFKYAWDNGSPVIGRVFTPELENLLGPARLEGEELTQRHKNLARSAQAMYEEAFFHLLNTLAQKYPSRNLALAGGCAMNSVANGKVTLKTPFEKLYVQSAAGDAGGAIGAAYAVWAQMAPEAPRSHMQHAYWGPSSASSAFEALIAKETARIEASGCSIQRMDDEQALCTHTAAAVADGKVIGWFQGRMEWGPRALGNRSIIGDPRRADMKNILNAKIKRRESFRPFAPSVLREAVPEWFELDGDVPFMMQVYPIRAEKRALIPAVTHVDGSGRLQTVTQHENARYYRLISCFHQVTGVPMVLNTSFNENEPVVCKPEEALDCFLRTKMDMLVLGDYVVERQGGG